MPDSTAPSPNASSGAPWIIRSGAMGDMIMMTAVCDAVARKHGEAVHLIATGGWSAPILERCSAVGVHHVLESMKTPWAFNPDKRRVASIMRAAQPGMIYVCGGDPASLALAQRSGLPDEQISWLGHQPPRDDEHVIDAMLRFVEMEVGAQPRLELRSEDRDDAAAWMQRKGLQSGRFILVQPGNKKTMRRGSRRRASNVKYWPEEHWRAVLAGLHERQPEDHLVLCGTASERELADDIARKLPAGVAINAAGDLPIPRLCALAEQAHAMVSVDTGPAHAAAAVGCPLLVLFGSTDPRKYRPRGPAPVQVVTNLAQPPRPGPTWWAQHHSMERLTPEVVLNGWDELVPTIDSQEGRGNA